MTTDESILLLSYSSKIFEYKYKFCSVIQYWIMLIFELHCTACHLTLRIVSWVPDIQKDSEILASYCIKNPKFVARILLQTYHNSFYHITVFKNITVRICHSKNVLTKKSSCKSTMISMKNTKGRICFF